MFSDEVKKPSYGHRWWIENSKPFIFIIELKIDQKKRKNLGRIYFYHGHEKGNLVADHLVVKFGILFRYF
jgi:hypothetical protein